MRLRRIVLLFTTVFASMSMLSFALTVTVPEVHLHLPPGANNTYTFSVISNESYKQDITVYIGDWTRTSRGVNDYLILDSGRWLFARAFHAGDELDIKYRVFISNNSITVNGTYLCGNPFDRGEIEGESRLLSARNQTPSERRDRLVVITRTVLSNTDGTATVNLHVHALQDFGGLRIDETFSSHVDVESIDAAGGLFSTVSRSCGDWITASPQTFTLAPGETQPVSFRISVPSNGVSGMYWAMIFVQGSPRPQQRGGATVLTVGSIGIKVYETVPGSEVLSGEVKSVHKVSNEPLAFDVTFVNTGNVQLLPHGTIDVISQNGDIVRTLVIDEFPVLPGKELIFSVTDKTDVSLPAGIYRALVTIDYGGDNLAGGTRDFRLR